MNSAAIIRDKAAVAHLWAIFSAKLNEIPKNGSTVNGVLPFSFKAHTFGMPLHR